MGAVQTTSISTAALLDDLAVLVGTESPSLEPALLATSAATLAAMIGERLGSPAQVVDSANGPHVLWQGDGPPRVLIVGHHDTVFPTGTVAARPFTVEGDRATGPGVFDMKAGIVQAIHAVAALDDRSGVELLFTSDEEVGSTASRALIEERAAACGAVLVLEPSYDGGALKTARKGTGTFEIVLHGRAAHAGLEPEKGINSLIAAAEVVLATATFGDPDLGTTVTPTVLHGGTADNVVPAETRLRVDVRVAVAGERERLESLMHGLTTTVEGVTIDVQGGIGRPPMPESASATLFPLAVAAAEDAGLAPLRGIAVGGGSDGNYTAAIGVPTLDGLGAVGGGAHADHEWVDVTTLAPRAELLAGIIRRIQAPTD
jgi:glutamate carboxypeptidase